MIIWEEVCNLKTSSTKKMWASVVVDIGAVCCAAAILLSVTFPLFSFGTHPLPPPFYMDCQELTPLLTPRRAVTL